MEWYGYIVLAVIAYIALRGICTLWEGMTVSKCDSCDSAAINGVFCHERGCPRIGQVYRDGEWLRTYTCRECGNVTTDVDEYERCCMLGEQEVFCEEENDVE